MQGKTTERGFVVVVEERYQNNPGEFTRLIQESSAIGNYGDALDNPGSSYLWVGSDHHLNREQVAELIGRMQHWLTSGRLVVDEPVEAQQPKKFIEYRIANSDIVTLHPGLIESVDDPSEL